MILIHMLQIIFEEPDTSNMDALDSYDAEWFP